MRQILRELARANMRKNGIIHPNRKMFDGRSYFSHYWRKYI